MNVGTVGTIVFETVYMCRRTHACAYARDRAREDENYPSQPSQLTEIIVLDTVFNRPKANKRLTHDYHHRN